jgi:cell fate regulator YaaT (PSP1 superfamily)
MDILDQEAEEDESLREQYPNINLQVSTDANKELVTKYQRLQSTLDQSLPSDERIRQKWADWAQVIEQLTWEEVCTCVQISKTNLDGNGRL